MVCRRLTGFLLVLFLLHVIIRAYSHQTTHKMEARRILGEVYKEINNVGGVPFAAEVVGNKRFRGRKEVAIENDLMRTDGARNEKSNQVVEVSGACSSKNGTYHPKLDVFAELSADYFVPRSHPPQNN